MKSNAERQATLRARRLKDGYRQFQVWAHPADWPLIKKLVERLMKRRSKK